jgi:hypothetical protein
MNNGQQEPVKRTTPKSHLHAELNEPEQTHEEARMRVSIILEAMRRKFERHTNAAIRTSYVLRLWSVVRHNPAPRF